jgi:1-acyl-sn-glycerol-3-phosphate acyltransferase
MIERTWAYNWIARTIVRLLFPLLARLRVEGVENIPTTGPVILTPNHLNLMDIPAMSVRVPRVVHHMAKDELFQVPLLGGIMRYFGAFPIRRGESDRDALRQAGAVLAAGQVLVVFPEGHRSDNHALGPGLPGVAMIALRAGAPIVPVAVWGTERIFKRGRFGPFAPVVHVRYGEPFYLARDGASRHATLQTGIDTIMHRIAAMLPPEYRGLYGAPAAPALEGVPPAAAEPRANVEQASAAPSATEPPAAG